MAKGTFHDLALKPSETLVFQIKPAPMPIYQTKDMIFIVPFVIIWIIIALFLIQLPSIGWLLLVAHSLLGYYFLIRQYRERQRMIARSEYMLTNQRLLIFSPRYGDQVVDVQRKEIDKTDAQTIKGGTLGTVWVTCNVDNKRKSYRLDYIFDAERISQTLKS
ncbi:hypothetical protein MASR2M15_06750 [Anaerolineales bacterium]